MTTTIFARVKNALATIAPAVAYGLAPYKTVGGALPDTYLAYSLVDGSPALHAENSEQLRGYRVQVSIYSLAGLASLPNVDAAMIAAGFQRGPERQLPQDPDTGHFGLAKDYFYLDDPQTG